MDIDLRPVWVPLVQRVTPIGPGGVTRALSLFLRADASHMVHVTRHADVREVWERAADFSVRVYGQRMAMTTGDFLLGITDAARHAAEARIIGQVIRRDDTQLVEGLAAEETERALSRLRARGELDVVGDLANEVPIRVVMRYLGIDGVDPGELLRLFQSVSFYIFAFWEDAPMRAAAVVAGARLKQLLADAVTTRRAAAGGARDDVLGRMLTMKEPFADGDAGIARSLAGLGSGMLNAPMGLFINVVDKLLALEAGERATLQTLARAASEPELMRRFREFVLEAERFGVFPGVLHRYVERRSVLAAGTARERTVEQGTTLVVWPSLAAFDETVFPSPFTFVRGRPRTSYLGFGHGLHRCLGEHVGQALIEQMTRALFALQGLRREHGRAGTVQNGPLSSARFPVSFRVRFDAR